MHPELFNFSGHGIPTYGFCMMIGFLSAVWFAIKRAEYVKANPDVILDLSFVSLLFGVAGARVFYVVHYWGSQFAHLGAGKWWAVVDISSGGLEFLGGFLGAAAAVVVYLWYRKQSLRMYLDILTPFVMWGLAFGRIGCFFNGCCFGGACVLPHDHAAHQTDHVAEANRIDPLLAKADYPWAIRFPNGSPAQYREWEDRQITVPAELIFTGREVLAPQMVPNRPDKGLGLSYKNMMKATQKIDKAREQVNAAGRALREAAKESPADEAKLATPKDALRQAAADYNALEEKYALGFVERAQEFPSRKSPSHKMSVSELQQLAAQYPSLPVHPTQLYSSINALLLYGVLTAIFFVRKRHGVVFGWLLILYAVPRMLLEAIRADNPHHGGLTASQWVGAGMIAAGIIYLVVTYRFLPERSPLAVPFVPPQDDETDADESEAAPA